MGHPSLSVILNIIGKRYLGFFLKFNLSTGTCFIHGSSFLINTRHLTWDRTAFASLAYISVISLFAFIFLIYFHEICRIYFSMPTYSQQLKSGLILINWTVIAFDYCFLHWQSFKISRITGPILTNLGTKQQVEGMEGKDLNWCKILDPIVTRLTIRSL